MEWEILSSTDDLQRAIMAFPAGIQARYFHLAQCMLTSGPDLGMPHSRAMGKGLFELRTWPAAKVSDLIVVTRDGPGC